MNSDNDRLNDSHYPNYLAFDFGMKRIGLAVGQSLTGVATPLPHFKARDGIPQWEAIGASIKEWNPAAIIVGLPLTMEDKEQEMTRCARKFSNRLREKFKLPVYYIDERLSSFEARDSLFAQGGYKSLKKGEIDSMAAKLILEDWLRQHANDNL